MVFGVERDELIETLTALRRYSCDYDSGHGEEPSICDCKYGFNQPKKGMLRSGEKNGCPELRSVVMLLEELTDGEFELIGERIMARVRRRAADLKELNNYERSK